MLSESYDDIHLISQRLLRYRRPFSAHDRQGRLGPSTAASEARIEAVELSSLLLCLSVPNTYQHADNTNPVQDEDDIPDTDGLSASELHYSNGIFEDLVSCQLTFR